MDRDEVRAFLEQRVLGQPEAIEQVVDLITVFKAGLHDPNKPLATLFFVGPTGVGKTELAKALAEFLFGSRERADPLRHGRVRAAATPSPKLLGSGWSAERKGGELTRRVREQPFCVVLLDEIEKAHPDVFDALLSALGEGRLTDARGQHGRLPQRDRDHDLEPRREPPRVERARLHERRRRRGRGGAAAPALRRAGREVLPPRVLQPHRPADHVLRARPGHDPLDRAPRTSAACSCARGSRGASCSSRSTTPSSTMLAQAGFHPRYGARPLLRAIEQRGDPAARARDRERAPGARGR